MLALPEGTLSAAERDRLEALLPKLPALALQPLIVAPKRFTVVSPCRLGGRTNMSHVNNHEPAELYPIWPFAFYTGRNSGGSQDLELGRTTFQYSPSGGYNAAWGYDGPVSATLGLASHAWSDVAERFLFQGTTDGSRFPGYLSSATADGAPETESGGLASETLQLMLLQSDPSSRRVFLFPAWPASLDVRFKLHAPLATVIEGELSGGVLTSLRVTPPGRRADVVVLEPQ